MKKDEYKCELCKNIYSKGWSDEEANEEAKQWTGDDLKEGLATICDDCYNEFMRWRESNNKPI